MKKIDSTKRIRIGTVLRVYLKGYGYSHMTLVDSGEEFFSARTDLDFLAHVQEGDLLETYLWVDDAASYTFPLTVIGKVGKYRLLFFDHTDSLVASPERKCIKATVEIPIKFFVFDVPSGNKNFSSNEIVFHRAVVKEFSDREALLLSEIPLEIGTFIKGRTRLQGEEIDILGKVVKGSSPETGYIVEYQGMNDDTRKMILDYIFNIYRE